MRIDSKRLVIPSLVLACLALAAAGCPEHGEKTTGDTSSRSDTFEDTGVGEMVDTVPKADGDANRLPDGGVLIEDLTAVPNPSNALSHFIEWKTTEPADTQLWVECGDGAWRHHYQGDSLTEEHRVFVMGHWAGASCEVTARSSTEQGLEGVASTRVEVGELPDYLPEITVSTHKPDKMQSGWTLLNLTNSFDDIPLTVAMIDDQGRYRWYHQRSTSNSGSDTDVRVVEEGVLIGGNRTYLGPAVVDWTGQIVWKDDFKMHHDIRPFEDGKYFLYLREVGKKNCDNGLRSGAVVKYDRMAEKPGKRWELCDYYTPMNPKHGADWSHLNSVVPVPGEEAVLLSSRHQHSLFKLNLATDQLDWKMGLKGDFGLGGDDLFYRQHAPEIQPNGNILLFDNGRRKDRPYSRAVEIEYDKSAMTAEVVWKFRPQDDIFTPIWGDADRLENGNTLITFGHRNKDNQKNSRLIEVTHSKQKVWDAEVENKWGWYRSERVEDLPIGSVR